MDPKKKKAKATTVEREVLRATFVALDQAPCDTPLRDKRKALYAQNFAVKSIRQHQEYGTVASPSTQLLHFATCD
jgi:hypothetical protein